MTTVSTATISNRTNGYMVRELLKRAQPLLVLNRFGQSRPLPKNSTETMRFRGYAHISSDPKPLTEGVTPASSPVTYVDKIANIDQYGDWIELTDVIHDTHEDPLLNEFSTILGEQSAIMIEKITAGVLTSGTSRFFAGETAGTAATARDEVNKTLDLNLQRSVVRFLNRQNAPKITKMVSASEKYDTSALPAAFIAICHTDLEQAIRDLPGFIPAEKYATSQPFMGEIGSCEGIRYIATTVLEPWLGEGAAGATGMLSTDKGGGAGACADVYPIIYLGQDAYGTIPLAYRASNSGRPTTAPPVSTYVLNPNIARGGDPLGQRGSVGWKAQYTSIILYDFWMACAEVSVKQL